MNENKICNDFWVSVMFDAIVSIAESITGVFSIAEGDKDSMKEKVEYTSVQVRGHGVQWILQRKPVQVPPVNDSTLCNLPQILWNQSRGELMRRSKV